MKFKPLSTPGLTQEQFETEMAFAPRHYFFATIEEFAANLKKRVACLRALERVSAVDMGKEFREDFLSRND